MSTKYFCDICGEPALSDGYVRIQINAGEPWSGTRCDPGSSGATDGTRQPVVFLEGSFQLKDGKRPADRLQSADICADCRTSILTELLSKYASPPKPI